MQTSAGVQGEHQNEHGMTRYQTCFRSCWDFPTQSSPRFTEDGLNVTGEQQFSGRRCFSDVREEVCRAWQEGKSDSNNHVLPPKSFSECTSCWKAASDHRAPHRPATNRNLRLQYAQAFCSRLWYKHHNSMDSSCTESVVLQCEGYFHVHAFLTTVYQLLQDDV